MLATVMALYSAAGPITPHGRRTQEVLRKKLAVLVAAVMMLGVMSAAPALAHHDAGHFNNGNQAGDGADANEGGGQEHIRNPHPPKAGGEKHGGGDGDNGGGND
jgi:hypothetical protein